MQPRGNDEGEYVLGRDGRPLMDRFGRPVRRRPAQRPQPRQQFDRPRERPPRRVPPPQPGQPPRTPPQPPQPQPRPQQPAPRFRVPRSRRVSRPHGCLRMVGVALVVVLVLGVVMALIADAKLARVDATPADKVPNTAGMNWLLVGSDSRQGLSDGDAERLGTGGDMGTGRTDTIMMVHIPTFGGKATLMSIPRDSYVDIPGQGKDKINAAFAIGGPELLVDTVQQNTGLRVDHYAEIGFGGFAGVVDALGGVDICVKEPINDPLAHIDLQPGCQSMDGPTALGYVRTRATAQGDLDRVQRQREFFSAIMAKISSPGTVLNPFKSVGLVNELSSTITVGKGDHVWNLASLALAMKGDPKNETVPVGGFQSTDVGSVVLWDEQGSQDLFNSLK